MSLKQEKIFPHKAIGPAQAGRAFYFLKEGFQGQGPFLCGCAGVERLHFSTTISQNLGILRVEGGLWGHYICAPIVLLCPSSTM